MSVRFTLVTRLVRNVSSRLPSSWRKSRARRAAPPAKREPKTASACSSTKTGTKRSRSRGWYSRSASWMTVISQSARASPAADGRPLAAVAGRAAGRASRSSPVRPPPRSSTSMGPSPRGAGGEGGGQGDAAGGGEGGQHRGAVGRGVVDHHHLQAAPAMRTLGRSTRWPRASDRAAERAPSVRGSLQTRRPQDARGRRRGRSSRAHPCLEMAGPAPARCSRSGQLQVGLHHQARPAP